MAKRETGGTGRRTLLEQVRRFIHFTRLTSWAMFGTAISIFGYVGSNVAYTADTQASLTSSWDKTHPSLPGGGQLSQGDALGAGSILMIDHPRLQYGQPLAKIVVPAIDWKGVILEGTDDRVLSGGPGHVPYTAYPGEPDNMVISNHNSYSLAWDKIQPGDVITIQAAYGTFTYRVSAKPSIVDAKDGSITASHGNPPKAMMTFVTCYPLWAGALARQRFVIYADLVRAGG